MRASVMPLPLKEAPVRAAGPGSVDSGMDADGSPAPPTVDVIGWTRTSKWWFCHRAGQDQPDQVCTTRHL